MFVLPELLLLLVMLVFDASAFFLAEIEVEFLLVLISWETLSEVDLEFLIMFLFFLSVKSPDEFCE
jgi:hypothetical protein